MSLELQNLVERMENVTLIIGGVETNKVDKQR